MAGQRLHTRTSPAESVLQQRHCLSASALPMDCAGGHTLTNCLAVHGLGKHVGGIVSAGPLDKFRAPRPDPLLNL
eukprot:12790079-Alexandrium_andersonii.AAC.1